MSEVNSPAIACLLWDVDGTLTDTTSLIAESLDYIYRKHYGQTLPYEELRALIGTPLWKQIRVFGEPSALGADANVVMEDFIAHYEGQKSRERIIEPVVALLIEGKKRGIPTVLVTSKNRQELSNTLPRLGIADYVDFAITADDVSEPKPDPEGLRIALGRLRVDPQSAYYIGDTVHDMQAAKTAGVPGIAVTWGAGPRGILKSAEPVFLCDTPAELETILFGKKMEPRILADRLPSTLTDHTAP